MAQKTKYHYALGRRKTAVATVRLFKGKGVSTINEKPVTEVYPHSHEQISLLRAFEAAKLDAENYYFLAKVKGSGVSGQMDAIKLALTRAIIKTDPTLKKQLKSEGLTTRDPRMVERKKAGLHKARKAEQYSKR